MKSNIISTISANRNAAVATTSGPAVLELPNGTPGGVVAQSAAVMVMTVASVSFTQPQPCPTFAQTAATTSSRFRVVKLDSSSEPFKKGRWTCTHYHDRDAPVSAPSFSTPEVTPPVMRAAEGTHVPECFVSTAGWESTSGTSVRSTVGALRQYTNTVGRVEHSQDYVSSLQGFQTSLFNGLNMGVSHKDALIHKDLTQGTGFPSAPTSTLQSVSLTGVHSPIGNPTFAVSQQQLTYAQAVARQPPGSNQGLLMAVQMRLQQTTSFQVNTFSVVPQAESALLALPKLAEASQSPVSAAFGPGAQGNSSALTSTVLFKAIDGEDDGVVAIDNKIEQAMDLVKSHLMFAVREEVEVLKEQIKDLIDRNSQLEQENTLLKTLASPEQIAQFQSQVQTGSPPASVATAGPQNSGSGAPAQPASHNSVPSA
ncbi:hypothetical protein CRUP_024505 [Coryphaenoides rupestris]|nr:hypothetical protein CRUP_024505 [Coryphaenoides rupestris]